MKIFLKTFFLPVILVAILVCPQIGRGETAEMEIKFLEDSSWDRNADDFLLRMARPSHILNYVKNTEFKDFDQLVEKEPEYETEMPLKGIINLGTNKYPAAFDSTDFAEEGFNRMIIDMNKNGDLTDDDVISANAPKYNYGGNYKRIDYPVITLKAKANGKEYDYAFLVEITSNLQNGELIHANATARTMAYRTGTIQLAEKERKIYLIDFNSNGLYNDSTSCVPQAEQAVPDWKHRPLMIQHGDALLIDPDMKDKTVMSREMFIHPERHYVSDVVKIDDSFYDLEIEPSGASISLTTSDVPLGSITNQSDKFVLSIIDIDKNRALKVTGKKGQEIKVPVGNWSLYNYYVDVSKNDKKKTHVMANGTYEFQPVQVKSGETTAFPFAEMFVPNVLASNYGGMQDSVRVGLDLKINDKAGALCTSLSVNGSQPEAPKFVISNEDGKVLERGSFEYG